MNKFKVIKYTGMGMVMMPILLIVVCVGIYLGHTSRDHSILIENNARETYYDTVTVHKTVTDTVRIKVFEKVPAPKAEAPSTDSL